MKLLCEKNFVLLEVVLATIILEIVPNSWNQQGTIRVLIKWRNDVY